MFFKNLALALWVFVASSNGSSDSGRIVNGDPNETVTMMLSGIRFSPLPDSLPFFMLGDFGGAPGTLHNGGNLQWKHEVAERMGLWATALRPRFVVGLGDNFYDVGVETAEDSAWDEQFESVYSSPALLDVPWLMCLGNHDYMGNAEAQIERTLANPNGRWQMPSRAYSRQFVHGSVSVEIFSVDTNAVSYTLTPETAGSCPFAEPAPGCSPLFEEEGERVVAELEKLLAASAATWKIVVGHHPLFSAGHHGSAEETAPLREALLPLLGRYGVDLYACGHDHIAQHVVPTAGRGGATDRPPKSSPSASSREGGAQSNEEEEEEEEEEERASAVMDASYYSTPRGNYSAAEGGEGGTGARGGGGQGAEGSGAGAGAVVSTTDHVTIGTSGPMVMPGEYDFDFENGGGGFSQVGGVEDAVNTGEAGSTDGDGGGGAAAGGEGSGSPRLGFELWYATKRRAFGVVEASEATLRISFVGKDGDVLCSFDRRR